MTRIARWVSVLGHPFVMVVLLVSVVALRRGTPVEAARTVALVALLSVLPIAILMFRQVRRGSWGNVDASNRSERPVLFLVAGGSLLVLAGLAFVLRPQSFLTRGVLGSLALLAVCAIATRWLKVSLHMAFGALTTTILLLLGSAVGWTLLPFLPVLGWSRLRLGRHSVAEVMAGTLAGVVAGFAMYRL
jgi:membrane-associated phospholipid phosphatase